MVSLNDLEAQIGALEDSDSEESEPEQGSEHGQAEDAEHAEDVEEEAEEGSEEQAVCSSVDAKETKRGRGRGREGKQKGGAKGKGHAPVKISKSKGICFKHLYGACKFDDCKFRHIKPSRLSTEDVAEILQELPQREFRIELRDVIRDLNIPKCKDFHQRGGCHRAAGKCHFWHLNDAAVARWAGFDFWCDVCSKGFTSEEQMDTHLKGRAHLEAAGQQQPKGGRASGRATGRGGRGGGHSGRGGGYGRSDNNRGGGGRGTHRGGSLGRGKGDDRELGGGRGRGSRDADMPPTKRARGRS